MPRSLSLILWKMLASTLSNCFHNVGSFFLHFKRKGLQVVLEWGRILIIDYIIELNHNKNHDPPFFKYLLQIHCRLRPLQMLAAGHIRYQYSPFL